MKNRNKDDFGFFPVNEKQFENPCFECGDLTHGKHHVIPVVFGGTKVIPLCEICHNKVHQGLILSVLIKEGLGKAKAKGTKLGAPTKITEEIIRKAHALRASGLSYAEIRDILGVSTGAISKILNTCKNI